MELTSAIAVIETDLRRLVGAVMTQSKGVNWLESSVAEEVRDGLQARREEEAKRRAPIVVPQDLLSYTHFYELRKVITKNWELFKPALEDRKEFDVFSDKIEDFRNAPAHSRELLPHELTLLDGIAGTIRARVTTYLSSQDPSSAYYPVLESIRDSFGNEVTLSGHDSYWIKQTGLRLQVGDRVTFNVRGWDAQNRELHWRVGSGVAGSDQEVRAPSGQDVQLTWVAKDSDVADIVFVYVTLTSQGAKYHRHTAFDHRACFGYTVDPPS